MITLRDLPSVIEFNSVLYLVVFLVFQKWLESQKGMDISALQKSEMCIMYKQSIL